MFGVMLEAVPLVVAPFFAVYIEAGNGIFLCGDGEGFEGVAVCFFGKGVGQTLAKPWGNGCGGARGGDELEIHFDIPATFAVAIMLGVFIGFEGDLFVFGVPESDAVGLGVIGAERVGLSVVDDQRGGAVGSAV